MGEGAASPPARRLSTAATIVLLALGGGLVLAALAWAFLRPSLAPGPAVPAEDPAVAARAFERAFFRRLSPSDDLLHAVRREWFDVEENPRWAWYVSVRPGADLAAWLATDPFGMVEAERFELERYPDPPAWFPSSSAGFRIRRQPGSNLVHLLAPDGTLHAADHGGGLRPPLVRPGG